MRPLSNSPVNSDARELRALHGPDSARRLLGTLDHMRRAVLTSSAVGSAALGAILLWIAFFTFFGSEQQRNTDRRIDAVFAQASRYVAEFAKSHGRLPLQSEFVTWADAQSPSDPGTFSVRHVFYQLGTPPKELVDAVGPPATDTYYLSLWRGEWNEYFAPWVGRSTIEPSDIKWYLTTYFSTGMVFLVFGVGLLFLCGRLWSNRRMQPTPTSGAADPGR